jgi:hypothetical protein
MMTWNSYVSSSPRFLLAGVSWMEKNINESVFGSAPLEEEWINFLHPSAHRTRVQSAGS